MERVFRLFIVFVLASFAGLIYFCLTNPDLVVEVGLRKLRSPTGVFIVIVFNACCLKVVWNIFMRVRKR